MCWDCSKVTYYEFTNILKLPASEGIVQQLFKLYDKVFLLVT